jgi:hypothetical protein
MLDAMARLEQTVREHQAAPADPSIRLLVQRLKDVSQSLDHVVADMRANGFDETLCAGIESQARAVAGLLRLNSPAPGATLPPVEPERPRIASPAVPSEIKPLPAPNSDSAGHSQAARLAALARLDQMSIAEKLEIFR